MLNLNFLNLVNKENNKTYIAVFCTNAPTSKANNLKVESVIHDYYLKGYINKSIDSLLSIEYMNCLNNSNLHNALSTIEFYKKYTVSVNSNGKINGNILLDKTTLDLNSYSGMFEK